MYLWSSPGSHRKWTLWAGRTMRWSIPSSQPGHRWMAVGICRTWRRWRWLPMYSLNREFSNQQIKDITDIIHSDPFSANECEWKCPKHHNTHHHTPKTSSFCRSMGPENGCKRMDSLHWQWNTCLYRWLSECENWDFTLTGAIRSYFHPVMNSLVQTPNSWHNLDLVLEDLLFSGAHFGVPCGVVSNFAKTWLVIIFKPTSTIQILGHLSFLVNSAPFPALASPTKLAEASLRSPCASASTLHPVHPVPAAPAAAAGFPNAFCRTASHRQGHLCEGVGPWKLALPGTRLGDCGKWGSTSRCFPISWLA